MKQQSNQVPSELTQHFFKSVPELKEIAIQMRKSQMAESVDKRDLETEYELLRALTTTKKHKLLLRTNGVLENKLNRYTELEIYQFSRVILKRSQPKQLDYINANYVKLSGDRQCIVTQGPLPTTIADFFAMLNQQKVNTVVMLCNVVEDGRVRCQAYFDNLPEGMKLQSTEELYGRKIVRRIVRYQTGEVLLHLQYTDWPDKDTPKDYEALWELLELLQGSGNTVYHCSAGIGRSGVIVCLMECIRQLRLQGETSIFEVCRRVRDCRYGAIQNNLQYQFLYDFLRWSVQQQKI